MTDFEFENILKNDIRKVDNSLLSYLPDAKDGQYQVAEAMKYSLINGGKRIRPVLALEFARACGGTRNDCLPLACALEYVHTYSLIHDDLPCMDNDDLRRGKPSCHKQFDEATALLAGDALLTHAFEIISEAELSDDKKVIAVSLLAQNSGVSGMIGGQVIDLLFEQGSPNLKELLTVYKLKTGALISAACLLGCISAGADSSQMAAASKFAYSLGIAFQIQDDILDITGDEKKLGKPVGSDATNSKKTYATIAGLTKAQQDVKKLTDNAISQLDAFEDTEFIKLLALKLVNRDR
ncbi:MAG TPA: polyprenyl synthetase family protein [Candidatus Eubacterium faecigallinarum]|nr:polyprenyl synthetase family protein [Candidatus Eubacterium faecigallinarum]